MSVLSSILFGIARVLATFVCGVCFRVTRHGTERVPADGGLLLVVNHHSLLDPVVLGYVMPRRIDFMAMTELFRLPVVAAMLRAIGAFPVDRRRHDTGAVREAVRRLRAGRCVCVFPEGGIRLGTESVLGGQPAIRSGAGLIALLSGATILPVIVRDTRKPYRLQSWFRRETMSVTFGHPFCLWIPAALDADQRRDRAREVLHEALLKTVELGG